MLSAEQRRSYPQTVDEGVKEKTWRNGAQGKYSTFSHFISFSMIDVMAVYVQCRQQHSRYIP